MSSLAAIGSRLYRGDFKLNIVGRQKLWYSISGLILVISLAALFGRGLNQSVDFKGGSVFQFTASNATTQQVNTAFTDAGVPGEITVQKAGQTGWRVETETLTNDKIQAVQNTIAQRFDKKPSDISPQSVGASWGRQISQKALQGLIAFLIVVVLYLSLAFEWRMAAAALVALVHNVVITVGVYALVGFQVSPATVIGLLTILGYSMYDTVVVFDKVRENTGGIAGGNRITYSDAANLAVNQTLVRSINTSVIALLPIGGLLFIGAGLLGAGTLKDLALVLFVGILAGTWASICIATPVLADLKEREPQYAKLRDRVAQRKSADAKKARQRAERAPVKGSDIADAAEDGDVEEDAPDTEDADLAAAATGPRSGAGRPGAQLGQRSQPRRGGSKRRPSGKKKR